MRIEANKPMTNPLATGIITNHKSDNPSVSDGGGVTAGLIVSRWVAAVQPCDGDSAPVIVGSPTVVSL